MRPLQVRVDLWVIYQLFSRVGCEIKLVFKRSLTGLNLEFASSSTGCLAQAKESSRPNYLPITGGWIIEFIPFPSGISTMWNKISLVQDLNSSCRIHFLRRKPLQHGHISSCQNWSSPKKKKKKKKKNEI